jgi:A/G-specific adenine glycosylase
LGTKFIVGGENQRVAIPVAPPARAGFNPHMVPPHSSPVLEVSAGLVFRAGRLLITQRPPGGHLAGLWEFPGGKREPAETYEACLQRELREEVGIEVRVEELVESLTHVYPERTVHLRFFRCTWLTHEPVAQGCPAFRWVLPDELELYEFPAADARLLEGLRTRHDLWRQD